MKIVFALGLILLIAGVYGQEAVKDVKNLAPPDNRKEPLPFKKFVENYMKKSQKFVQQTYKMYGADIGYEVEVPVNGALEVLHHLKETRGSMHWY